MIEQLTFDALTIESLTECFKALSDPSRLRILSMLRGGEKCVCELVPHLGISQPAVSTHLRKLRQAKLVREHKRGQWVYYEIDGRNYSFFKDILDAFPSYDDGLNPSDSPQTMCATRPNLG